MEIKVLEQTKDNIKIEIIGEDHTLANSIRKELWEDSHVTVAGYNIEHPLTSNPVLIVKTDGNESPRKALQRAVDSLKEKNKELNSMIKSAKWS